MTLHGGSRDSHNSRDKNVDFVYTLGLGTRLIFVASQLFLAAIQHTNRMATSKASHRACYKKSNKIIHYVLPQCNKNTACIMPEGN